MQGTHTKKLEGVLEVPPRNHGCAMGREELVSGFSNSNWGVVHFKENQGFKADGGLIIHMVSGSALINEMCMRRPFESPGGSGGWKDLDTERKELEILGSSLEIKYR